MRLIVVWNVVITILLAVLLVSNRHDHLSKTQPQVGVSQTDILRVRRVEVVDQQGRLTAILGQVSEHSAGGLSLFHPDGRKAVALELNDRGYGTLYLGSKQTESKVLVGYFSGSDTDVPLSEEDPRGGWGMLVRRPNLNAPQVFGVQTDGRPIPTSP